MTRLITEWIMDMEAGCRRRDLELKEKTGLSLLELAAKAASREVSELERLRGDVLVAVVPVTAGLGVIGQFAQSVAAIVRTLGFSCNVTKSADVDGLYEAYGMGADLIFIADDNRFLAINTGANKIGENNRATAAGYVAALEAMMAKRGVPMSGAAVLVLGYGPVGKDAADILATKGALVTVFDKNQALDKPGRPEDIKRFSYIFEATPEEAWIKKEMLAEDALIAAPGIPLGLDGEAAEAFEKQLVHDMLDLGTATMLAMAI